MHLANAFSILINDGLIKQESGYFGSKNYADAILDFSFETAISGNDESLIDHLDLILCGGRLEASSKQVILDALQATNLSSTAKVKYATSLFMFLAEFNTLY